MDHLMVLKHVSLFSLITLRHIDVERYYSLLDSDCCEFLADCNKFRAYSTMCRLSITKSTVAKRYIVRVGDAIVK